ncbi:tail assembly protein [Lonepinella koalarum]|uniref:tail assembly protein n=1 Tax=Lonepinella koalarum TaxID=53417 RepID=UPI001E33BFE1|nr:tail assembly protein [Lonepinella koalarum]
MATITFHGNLKRFSHEPISLEVSNFKELMNGLLTQIQGLRQQLRQGYYKVRIGKNRYLSEQQIKTNPCITLDEQTAVHFTPVLSGAGKGLGIGQIILGAALIAVAWWSPTTWIASNALMMGAMGGAMLLNGTMSLLTKTPDMNMSTDSEKQQSTSFSNIKNLTPQGKPIPLLYGKMLTSLVLVSQGIETFDDM